jgi:uncharacterized membrane protein YqjE
MAAAERALSDVLQDIVRNVQEIVRSEARLAKTEIREEAVKAQSAATWLTAGAVTAMFAVLFLLLTIVGALALILPIWEAALIVAVALAVVSGATLASGVNRFKQLQATPVRTIENIKEDVEWLKQRSR